MKPPYLRGRTSTLQTEIILNNGGTLVTLKDGAIEKRVRHGPFDVITTESVEIKGKSAKFIIMDEMPNDS